MDKKARQLIDELLALKSNAERLAVEQREVGDKIQKMIEQHQRWLESQQAAEPGDGE